MVVEKCLPRRSLLKLVGDHRGERIACLDGAAWITQPGDPEDIVVQAGESFAITQKGTIVLQGMSKRTVISFFSTKNVFTV